MISKGIRRVAIFLALAASSVGCIGWIVATPEVAHAEPCQIESCAKDPPIANGAGYGSAFCYWLNGHYYCVG